MTFRDTKRLVRADLERVNIFGKSSLLIYFRYLIFNSSFKFCFWFRWASYFQKKKCFFSPIYSICWLIHRHYRFKFGYDIPIGTLIGGGIYLMHFGGVIINGGAVIGENSTIYQGVTVGMARLKGKNVPTIGNNCVLGAGSKVLGDITIGDYVMIGANAVVTKSVDSECVVAGNPARIINRNGRLYTREVIEHK